MAATGQWPPVTHYLLNAVISYNWLRGHIGGALKILLTIASISCRLLRTSMVIMYDPSLSTLTSYSLSCCETWKSAFTAQGGAFEALLKVNICITPYQVLLNIPVILRTKFYLNATVMNGDALRKMGGSRVISSYICGWSFLSRVASDLWIPATSMFLVCLLEFQIQMWSGCLSRQTCSVSDLTRWYTAKWNARPTIQPTHDMRLFTAYDIQMEVNTKGQQHCNKQEAITGKQTHKCTQRWMRDKCPDLPTTFLPPSPPTLITTEMLKWPNAQKHSKKTEIKQTVQLNLQSSTHESRFTGEFHMQTEPVVFSVVHVFSEEKSNMWFHLVVTMWLTANG